MTSARLFLKSDSATRPTVCVERRSSAVFCCDVNLGLGVAVREGGLDAMFADLVLVAVGGRGSRGQGKMRLFTGLKFRDVGRFQGCCVVSVRGVGEKGQMLSVGYE